MSTRPGEFRQAMILCRSLGARLLRRRAVAMLALSIFVSASIAAALGHFAENVRLALDEDVARFLGAPLVIRSQKPLATDGWRNMPGLRSAQTATFTAGAVGPGGYHSVAFKGVSIDYPVKGELRIRQGDGPEQVTQGHPGPGSAWLDNRAMTLLGASRGDVIQIGTSKLRVAAELTFEPDRLTQLQHTLPRVVVPLAALSAAGLDLNNGRGDFRYLFDGDAATLAQLETRVADTVDESYEVLTTARGNHPLSRMSLRAKRFLGMVSVLVLVLCGGAAAVLTGYVVRQYSSQAAVLRCFGAERHVVTWALMLQLLSLTVACGVAGAAAGWLAQPVLLNLLHPNLNLPGAVFTVAPALAAVGVALLTVGAFALPHLTALGRVPVVAALRRQWTADLRYTLMWISVSASVLLLLWLYSDNAGLTMMLALGIAGVVAVAAFVGWGLAKLAGQAHRVSGGWRRITLRSIGRRPARHMVSLATIALAVMAFSMTAMFRSSFLDTYHVQRLAHDGNFLFNGLPLNEVGEFERFLEKHDVALRGMYPTVRARLVAINETPVADALSHESDTREELRSPVRLSWAEQPPANNTMLTGSWPLPDSGEVSVDSEVMSDLGLSLGDTLTFRVGEEYLTTRIGSTRGFKGGGSSVMFWFMFTPDALSRFRQHYMGGVQIAGNIRETLAALVAAFPNLIVTELEQQIARVRGVMAGLTKMLNAILGIILCGAAVVILASALAASDARRRQAALLRSLGVTRPRLYIMMVAENGIVGLLACVVGLLGAHWVGTLIFHYQFAMPYHFNWTTVLLASTASVASFVAMGFAFERKHIRRSPTSILQQA